MAGVFSVFVNLLMLTGPIFMLQVYDRVLGSRSVETLLALTLLAAFLYLSMGILDFARGRILARIGARFQSELDPRVFSAVIRQSSLGRPTAVANTGGRDLDTVQRLLSSPVIGALFDLPWTPIFLIGISLFHPWLGILAMCGGGVLIVLSVASRIVLRGPSKNENEARFAATQWADNIRKDAETIQSLGMRHSAFARWQKAQSRALRARVAVSEKSGGFSVTTRTWRLFLQSAMLALGAYLVLLDQVSPGAMIASSILLGRALAPVELLVGQWSAIEQARRAWSSLAELLSLVPQDVPRTTLPDPQAQLDVHQLTVTPPGEEQASLRMVSFSVAPGEALGVIGPSGSGKSTLARALTGVWRPAAGRVRLDGASIDQYDPDRLGQCIGYLPQTVRLFDGTIAENIARLDPNASSDKVVEAAKRAAAHDLIVALPDGYDTILSPSSGRLSGGQIQRIGLARALYGDPVILILDEPNSNLDNEGSNALNLAIRQAKRDKRSVLIMAHRPAAIQECDLLMMLDGGIRKAFGPKEDVLKNVVMNYQQLQNTGSAGVA